MPLVIVMYSYIYMQRWLTSLCHNILKYIRMYIRGCYLYYSPETFLYGTLKPWFSISTITTLNCSCCVASQTCHTDVFT